jgi:MerR family copper efflux transcriptional regulator
MDGLPIAEAAQTTGWSPRMLRYVEQLGLVEPDRSPGGHRFYGPEQLQRLRTLRVLLDEHDLDLGDVGLALRLRREPGLRSAVEGWLDSVPTRPEHVPAPDWLRWEQEKHQSLMETQR